MRDQDSSQRVPTDGSNFFWKGKLIKADSCAGMARLHLSHLRPVQIFHPALQPRHAQSSPCASTVIKLLLRDFFSYKMTFGHFDLDVRKNKDIYR